MAFKPTLKPGQKKEIQLKVQKIKGMQEALRKLNDYRAATSEYSVTTQFTDSINKKIKELNNEIHKQYEILKKEVEVLKKKAAKAGGGKNKELDAFVKTLSKECSQVIPLYRKAKQPLMRGSNGDNGPVYMGRSWEKRQTKDSNHLLQLGFDTYLKSKGFKALRSNSIFATGDINQADEYGDVYYIYPKNGFAFHWYEAQDDMILDDAGMVFKTDYMEELISDAYDWYTSKHPSKEPPKAIRYADDYYDNPQKLITSLQKTGFPKAKNLKWEQFIDGPGIRLEIGPTQKNLLQGIKSGGEVCIAGEYYAIKMGTRIAAYVNKALGIKAEWDDDPDSEDEYDDEDGMGNPADDGYDDL